MTTIRDIAHFRLTKRTEEELTSFAERNLRRAPKKMWSQLQENATGHDAYIKAGPHVKDGPIVLYVDTDGTILTTPPPIASQIVTDNQGDLKFHNGVRLAYHLEHRNGFQHGRIRNIGGNLVLMPKPQNNGDDDVTDKEKSAAEVSKEIIALQRQMDRMKALLARKAALKR